MPGVASLFKEKETEAQRSSDRALGTRTPVPGSPERASPTLTPTQGTQLGWGHLGRKSPGPAFPGQGRSRPTQQSRVFPPGACGLLFPCFLQKSLEPPCGARAPAQACVALSLQHGQGTHSSNVTIRSSFPKRISPASVTTPGRWAPGMGKVSPSGTRPSVLSVEPKNVSFC